MRLSDFHFTLPEHLIAKYPLEKRTASRLLCLQTKVATEVHRQFTDVMHLIEPGDLLIFNNTKVLPARIIGKKITGGRVEMLIERVIDDKRVLAQMRASKSLRIGEELYFGDYIFRVLTKKSPFYELILMTETNVIKVVDQIGQIPIPPYLGRNTEEIDVERYQTVYANPPGSVAAPTAGLHFDENLLKELQQKGVDLAELTLHIGAGTFLPVRTEDITKHRMHAEYFEISDSLCKKIASCQSRGKRVIAVGTTTLRALETASISGQIQPYAGDTSIFIYPGFVFHCVDILITNLHLSGSSLLMLVAAFGGYEKVMCAYEEAVKASYRFYSYGDAMWVERQR